jgi:hypothetical protein
MAINDPAMWVTCDMTTYPHHVHVSEVRRKSVSLPRDLLAVDIAIGSPPGPWQQCLDLK